MSTEIKSDELVRPVIEDAERQMQSIDKLPFDPSAFSKLSETIAQYISELIDESVKCMKRDGVQTIAVKHVKKANEYLVSSTSRRKSRFLGTIGGTCFGIALTTFVAMAQIHKYDEYGTVVSLLFGLIGTAAIIYDSVKD
jgi:histone H3/H4